LAVAVAIAAGGLVATTAPARAAAADPTPGAACTKDDLGKRIGWPETAVVEPVITHFKAYFVTAGSTGQQVVTLTVAQVVTVTVLREKQINGEFGPLLLFKVAAMAKFSVTTSTASTNSATETITWNFNQPGYYGVYKGVRKVSGQLSTLNCSRVAKPDGTFATEWVRRPGGEYTTWGRAEEGVVRCEDTVPANSVLRAAQKELGCDDPATTAKHAPVARPVAASAPGSDNLAAAAVPSGFVCESGYNRIVSRDGTVMDNRTSGLVNQNVERVVRWLPRKSDRSIQLWRVCSGPDTDGFPQVVLVNRSTGGCLQSASSAALVDGAEIEHRPCDNASQLQRFYLYRDVPGSTAVGIQSAASGGMLGSLSVASGEQVRQYSSGVSDGSGTFLLQPA
jgi:hypothetical protein